MPGGGGGLGRRRDEKKHGGENKIVKRGKVEEGVLTVGDFMSRSTPLCNLQFQLDF